VVVVDACTMPTKRASQVLVSWLPDTWAVAGAIWRRYVHYSHETSTWGVRIVAVVHVRGRRKGVEGRGCASSGDIAPVSTIITK
jgi:hypothetical protein